MRKQILEIKDDTSLKKLKKFGFKYDKENNEWVFQTGQSWEKICVSEIYKNIYIEVFKCTFGAIAEDLLYKLYELIQAGLVVVSKE